VNAGILLLLPKEPAMIHYEHKHILFHALCVQHAALQTDSHADQKSMDQFSLCPGRDASTLALDTALGTGPATFRSTCPESK